MRRRHARARLAGQPFVLPFSRAWLALCTVAVATELFGLFTGSLRSLVGQLILFGIIWIQALLYYRARRRDVFEWPRRSVAAGTSDPLGTELLIAIGDVERVLFAALDEEGVVAAVPADELATIRMVATRAVGALRELRDQTIALDRATAGTVSPDRERLAGARETVRLRLMRGMRDCTELAVVASTPDADDFRPRFAAAATRLTALVADVKPLLR